MVQPLHFCKLSTVDIGKYFLRLTGKHFSEKKKTLKKMLTGKQLKLFILALIIYTKSLATIIKIQLKNYVLIDTV